MSLCLKKNITTTLKKPASLTTFHFKIPLVKICPPTRNAKNQDDISIYKLLLTMTSVSTPSIQNPRFTSRNKSRYNRFLEERLKERKVYLCLRVEVLNNHI